ncbi:MAG: hypothetical protein AB7T49_17960 [Oligoflexales bacterium]
MRIGILSALLLLAISSCKNKQGFSSNVASKKSPPPPPETLSKTFDVITSTSGSLDIVWSLDNSNSMSEENAQVMANINQLKQSLATDTSDVKVAILTCMGADKTLCPIPTSGDDKLFPIPAYKGGFDVLSVLAASMCPENLTSFTKYDTVESVDTAENADGSITTGGESTADLFRGAVCGVDMDSHAKDTSGMEWYLPVHRTIEAAGALIKRNVLRPDSTKIFVAVSDDNPVAYGAQQFKQAMDKQFGAGKYHFFAFAGKTNSSCPVVHVGVDYENLATATGGEVFDICPTDWSPQFSKLLSGIKKFITKSYSIEAAPGDEIAVQNVTINGTPLDPSQYTFANGELVLADSVTAPEGAKLVVTYTKKSVPGATPGATSESGPGTAPAQGPEQQTTPAPTPESEK